MQFFTHRLADGKQENQRRRYEEKKTLKWKKRLI